MIVVVMGVSGVGKSTVGRRVADRLGLTFVEGDDHHPAGNVAKMRGGTPLTDEDRWPWLDRLGRVAAEADVARGGCVVTCSALKRAYRERLVRANADLRWRFLHLAADPHRIRERMEARPDHFMPASLLESQLATLEPPEPDEPARTVDVGGDLDAAVESALDWLAADHSR